MAGMSESPLAAPSNQRAVMVLESGAMIQLRLKRRETLSAKRSVAKGAVESGYKITDGVVDDPKTIAFEGIITGTDLPYQALHMLTATSEVQSIIAAYDTKEFVSVYTSFIAMPQCVMTSLEVSLEAGRNCYNIKLEAERVEVMTFQRSRTIKTKTSKPAGKGTTKTGKKTATPVAPQQEPDHVYLFGQRA